MATDSLGSAELRPAPSRSASARTCDPKQTLPFPRLLLTAVEAAAMCGFSVRTWWRLESSGKIPAAVRLGRSKRWPAEELRAWVEAGCPDRKRWEANKLT